LQFPIDHFRSFPNFELANFKLLKSKYKFVVHLFSVFILKGRWPAPQVTPLA